MMRTTLSIAMASVLMYATVLAQLKPEDEGESIRERFKNFKEQRIPAGVTLPEDIRARAIEQTRRMEQSKLGEQLMAAQPQWTLIGPKSTGGRIKSILVHPTNPNIVYAAAAAGGVWKSTDAGSNWSPTMDDANGLALGSLCFDPSDSKTIYAGTGEQVTNGNTFLGCGLLRSTDEGETWKVVGLTHVGSFSRIYAHPKNPNLLMASCMNTGGGVYKSLDKGTTWQKVYEGTVYDMSINPADENEWFIATSIDGILYSNNGGDTWTPRMSGLNGTIGRISVQQSPVNPDRLFALAELNDLASLAYSTNKGQTWTVTYSDAQGCFFSGSCTPTSSQGFYDNYISASPLDEEVCYAGGIDIWRTTNGGKSWSNVTGGYSDGDGSNLVHVDQHCLAFDPNNPTTVYAGNDGGIVKSDNNGLTWELMNFGLSITQFYSFDLDPQDRTKNYGGTQDNGTLGSISGIEWDTVAGGDGMVTVVNYNNPQVVYGNQPNGVIFRINFGKGERRVIVDGLDMSETALWAAPLTMSPGDDQTLLHGRKRVWRTFDGGEFWFDTSPLFVNTCSALAMSPADPGVIGAASNSGELMVAEDDGFEWKTITSNDLARKYVSDIECSRVDRKTVWVSYGQYGSANLWKTTDLGDTWTPLWNGMPDVPVNSVKVHPDDENIIFIGTDVGVFASYDGGKNWMTYGKGLPRSPVMEIQLNKEYGVLRACTHGRSVWETELVSTAPTDPVITSPNGGDEYIGTLNTVISWAGFTPPVKIEYSVDDGNTWKDIAGGVIGNALSWKVPHWPTSVGRVRITSETTPAEQVVSKTFTINLFERGDVYTQKSVGWVPYGLAWDGKNSLWSTSFYEPKIYRLNATTLQVEKEVDLPDAMGDSLFTDITMDRSSGTIYMHRLNGSDGVGAQVFVLDTNGKLLQSFGSQARRYATGLEFVQGQLIAGERDGFQHLYVMSLDGLLLDEQPNPYRYNYGPRCLAYNDNDLLFQTCTFFPTTNGTLTECYVISIPTASLSTEQDRMPLEYQDGLINARAIEYDRTDGSFWVGDFGGNIYKITGFNFSTPPVSGVKEDPMVFGELVVRPNPSNTSALVTLGATTVDRRIELSVVDLFGNEAIPAFSMLQGSGIELALRISTDKLPSGTYTLVATTNGTVVSTTRLAVQR